MRNFDDDQTTVTLTPLVIIVLCLVLLLALILSPLWLPVLAVRWAWLLGAGYVAGVRYRSAMQRHVTLLYGGYYLERYERGRARAAWPAGNVVGLRGDG